MAYSSETDKIDKKSVNGLSGTVNSLAYKVNEIEKHLHSAGSWFGAAVTPDGTTHVADRIGAGVSSFQIDAGNNDWGAWVQVLGSEDTPARVGQAYFDPHLILITDAEAETTYFIQFSRGLTGDAGLAAGTYTELCVGIDATKKFKNETSIQTGRAQSGSLLWCRCLAVGENTGTLDFYIGLHEYEG